jgi:ATP-dependent Lon protease
MPVLPIRSTVVYPSGATALQIGYAPNVEALNAHQEPDLIVAIVATLDEGQDIPPHSLEKVATAVRVLDRLNLPGGTIQTTLQGLKRIHLDDVRFEDGFYTARPRAVEEAMLSPDAAEPVVERILTTVGGLASKVERVPDEVPRILRMNLGDPGRFADLTATLCNLKLPDRDAVLQELDVARRLDLVLTSLEQAWEQAREVEALAEEEAALAAGYAPAYGQQQERSGRDRTSEIRRRIQALQAELGEVDPLEREADEVLRKVERARLPSRVAAVARREAERLRSSDTTVQEAAEIRGYLDALVSVPWVQRAGSGRVDVAAVKAALADEPLGHDRPKRRLLEVVALASMRGDLRGPVPCLVGAPGVGKRTLATAVARGLERPIVRLELSGRGEAQLLGSIAPEPAVRGWLGRTRHRAAGAQMGRILTGICDAGVRNPVFLLDGLDEVGQGSVEGDPVEALRDMLDSEYREEFVDRFLDLPFDLSEVFFIASATDFSRVPRVLRDFFVEIHIPGYSAEQKLAIARDWLLPRIIREHGLPVDEVQVPDEALRFLIRGYARDPGVTELRRSLAAVMRYVVAAYAGDAVPPAVTPALVEEVLEAPATGDTEGFARSADEAPPGEPPSGALKVFLCHGREDKGKVRDLYRRLRTDGMSPWLDVEDLDPGADWAIEIPDAVRASDIVLVCLSRTSAERRGFVQKEIMIALNAADQMPEGARYIIPVKLEECEVPERLARWHWVDLFEPEGYPRLLRALRRRAAERGGA